MQRAMPMPDMMPANMSVFQYMGAFSVNGAEGDLATRIMAGDIVETNADTELVFVVNKDAFLLRANSRMQVIPKITGSQYHLERGKLMSVFAAGQTQISTPSAVIAIRGTGVYMESEPELSYICTCYGVTNIATSDDPGISETIESKHHDAPRYVLSDKNASQRIQPAPFINHDDQELLLIETLVGRSPPYVVPQGIKRSRGRYL